MKREHEIFVERKQEGIEEWLIIWKVTYLGKTPMGAKNFRRYEHIDIQTLLEPRDNTPAK